MLTKNILEMTARTDAHLRDGLLAQEIFFDPRSGRGCFVGAHAKSASKKALSDLYGIPVPLTSLLMGIFGRLPFAEAADFFGQIPRAIGGDGRSLDRVVWAFSSEMLRRLRPSCPRLHAVLDEVLRAMDVLSCRDLRGDERHRLRVALSEPIDWAHPDSGHLQIWQVWASVFTPLAPGTIASAARGVASLLGEEETRHQRVSVIRLIERAVTEQPPRLTPSPCCF